MSTGYAPIAGRERRLMDPRHAILFEPVTIGPKTLPNRFYQVPHASGFGSIKPRTQAAFRAIKAEGGWGGVCVEYAPVSRDADEVPAGAANIWDDDDARVLRLGRGRQRHAQQHAPRQQEPAHGQGDQPPPPHQRRPPST